MRCVAHGFMKCHKTQIKLLRIYYSTSVTVTASERFLYGFWWAFSKKISKKYEPQGFKKHFSFCRRYVIIKNKQMLNVPRVTQLPRRSSFSNITHRTFKSFCSVPVGTNTAIPVIFIHARPQHFTNPAIRENNSSKALEKSKALFELPCIEIDSSNSNTRYSMNGSILPLNTPI